MSVLVLLAFVVVIVVVLFQGPLYVDKAPLTNQGKIWMSGDTHIHSPGCNHGSYSPNRIKDLMEDKNVNLISNMVVSSQLRDDDKVARITGVDTSDSSDDKKFRYEIEIANIDPHEGGHLIFLDLDEDSGRAIADLARSSDSGVQIVDWAAKNPPVLIGMAHVHYWPPDKTYPTLSGCCRPFDLPVHVANGKLHFIGTEKPPVPDNEPINQGAMHAWRALSNLGFRLSVVASSDWDCVTDTLGPLTFALVDEINSESFYEEIRQGRTIVSKSSDELISFELVAPGNECGVIDCDDSISSINPDAVEICDDMDNNCNGEIDENEICEEILEEEVEEVIEIEITDDDIEEKDKTGEDKETKIIDKPIEEKNPQVIETPAKETEEEKDNSLIILLVIVGSVIIVIILGLIVYLAMKSPTDAKQEKIVVTSLLAVSLVIVLSFILYNQSEINFQPKDQTLLSCIDSDYDGFNVPGKRVVGLGEEVKISANEEFEIIIESKSQESREVELLVNGVVVETISVGSGTNILKTSLTLEKSSWLAVRTDQALSGAIYVLVDDKPIRASADDACYFIKYIDHLKGLAEDGDVDAGNDLDVALQAYADAREVFVQRFEESGGTICV
jgi:hypothetical protein